ncbi:pantoate--beta-alanine ligase [Niallia sp. MER 6]|uniref:pantoate--beta-alanine ligase n=1 Tax=Niallia sp. MER 6 TaxID=2939567 RepID=UPI00203F251B|nr:pantoate--beta-alanine ligase [Niallia sp. MER 6]MCM3031384.1 pantoate--beta-alanine ligase [Niallia sp. MER 6]
MKVIHSKTEMQQLALQLKKQQKTIGFVPTMGYLHEGHRALLQEARDENEVVVLSVFVNPLQFGPNEDLDSYPRAIEQDKKAAEEEGVDYLFLPTTEEMYPHTPSVTVHVQKRADILCGSSRPGHFDGVATVLTKLFQLIQPDNVYFGKKDAQQVAVVAGLIEDFHFPVKLHAVQTVREEDGLAKSSRNVKLSPVERKEAGILYQTLSIAREELIKGNHHLKQLVIKLQERIEKETSGKVDYLEILTYPELEAPSVWEGTFIIAIAVRFPSARLIDNIIFEL